MARKSIVGSSLSVIAVVMILAAGCSINISDGYFFTYKGKTASRTESGPVESSVTTIEIDNRFGDVHVEQTTGEGEWTWDGTCWAKTQEEADDFLSELVMNIEQDGDKQTWTVELPERDRKLRGVKSNLTIQVPAQVAVTIVNAHGNTTTHGISGSMDIENKHGDVEATSLSGETTITNRHGEIVADDFGGPTSITSRHGDVKIDGAADEISIDSQHGDIRVRNAASDVTTDTQHGETTVESASGTIRCDSRHGDVKITLTSADFESIVAESSHGDVDVYLPPSAKPNVKLTVTHGRSKSDFQSNDDSGAPRVKVKTHHGDAKVHED